MQQGVASAAMSVFCFEAEQGMKQEWSSEMGPGPGPGQRVRRGTEVFPVN